MADLITVLGNAQSPSKRNLRRYLSLMKCSS
jgi:hypothetical protein